MPFAVNFFTIMFRAIHNWPFYYFDLTGICSTKHQTTPKVHPHFSAAPKSVMTYFSHGIKPRFCYSEISPPFCVSSSLCQVISRTIPLPLSFFDFCKDVRVLGDLQEKTSFHWEVSQTKTNKRVEQCLIVRAKKRQEFLQISLLAVFCLGSSA